MEKNMTTGPPEKGRHFYSILGRADGRIDIYLDPQVYPMTTPEGATDYDISFRVVRGVDPADYGDMESHIREHYSEWCEAGEVVWM